LTAAPRPQPRILAVDDEPRLLRLVTSILKAAGFATMTATTGEEALERTATQSPDLILLDIMLPGMSGLEVLRVIRGEGVTTPVIVVSAKGEEIDRVVGLKVGADDYVAKPFSRPELLARIEAVLRRQRRAERQGDELGSTIRTGELAVDVPRREATFRGEPLTLTTKEFDLLAHLAGHPGRIFTRDQLLARLWGMDYEGDGRTVDVHVSWLRSKLRARDGHNYFRTVRGAGYAFSPRPARGA
jgi:two-component system alkaline phosphatase synthesis response regulator PhoP